MDDEDNLWQEFENSNMMRENDDQEPFKTELKLYLIESKISNEINPSLYWSHHLKGYPRLSVLALKYLIPSPSSAYSERCFSLSGEIISKKRTNIMPRDGRNFLVFLKKISIMYGS